MKSQGGQEQVNDLSGDAFEWREIPRATREEAEAEARRQQALDDPTEVEWIYLRNKNGEWVARRTPLRITPEKQSRWAALGAALIDGFH